EEEARRAQQRRQDEEKARAEQKPPVEAPLELTQKKAPEPKQAPGPKRAEAKSAANRSYRRVSMQTEVSLSSDSNFFAGFSQNLSEMGVFVATYSQLLPVGTEVELTLNLPGKPPLRVHGVVKWVRETDDRQPGMFPGMGILFEELSEADARHIKEFVAHREPLFWAE
ncbi:MAG: TIGR02266 family protein, partial [Myxococcales bacterium]